MVERVLAGSRKAMRDSLKVEFTAFKIEVEGVVENHFTEKLLKCHFEQIPGWECLFFHRRLKLILSVYVDDFKPVGKQRNQKEGWKLITGSGLVLDPPTPLGDYLGFGQFPVHVSPAEAQRRLEHVSPLLDDNGDLQM